MKENSPCILIAASGSGGHLFPARFIAQAISTLQSQVQIEFVGAGRPLEEKIISPLGIRRHVIYALGVKNFGLFGILKFCLSLPKTLYQTWQLLNKVRPGLVLGVGGYATVGPVVLAWLKGIPTIIHEAELSPGMANRFLALFAGTVSTAFREAKMPWYAKSIYTGHPVRPEIAELAKSDLRQRLLNRPPRRILVMGGSQGAASLDQNLPGILGSVGLPDLEVLHQCRPENVEAVSAAYAHSGVRARVSGFLDKPHEAYAWADLVIARSGAGTLNELEILGMPAILVPFPFAQGNHQVGNAQTLVRQGKALMVEEGPGFYQNLNEKIIWLLESQNYQSLIKASYAARSADAAFKIAQLCLDAVK